MTEREELLRRLERVKALAERGVGGEKENAEALLNRLMAKYGISEEDIEDTAERDYFIRYYNFWERKLIVQIAYKHLGSGIDRRTRSKALPGSMEDDDDE